MTDKYDYGFTISEDALEDADTSHTLILRQVERGSSVLECGPADGIMTRYLKEVLNCWVFIVEYNAQAFEKAMRYADDGVCADLEQNDWMESVPEGGFDYIICSDVLEHLRNPQAVLIKLRGFLKPEGAVLLSVPNVANGDIIANLLCGRFHYTPLGLLDDTHIHFFAREDLHRLIQDSGYYLAEETCTTCRPFTTEQGAYLTQKERKEIGNAVYFSPERSVYQFICRLSQTKVETVSNIVELCQKVNTLFVKLYLDMGDGYSEENTIILIESRVDDVFRSEAIIPEGCRRIRFDPDEVSCFLQDLLVMVDGQRMSITASNGIQVGEDYLFWNDDPHIEISVPEGGGTLEIQARITRLIVERFENADRFFLGLDHERKTIFDELVIFQDQYNEAVASRESLKKEVEDKERHIHNQNNMLAEAESKHKLLENTIGDKERHIKNQAQIIETTQTALEEVQREVADKERHIENQAQIIETTQAALDNTRQEVADKERHIENQNYIIETIREVLDEVRREVADKERYIEKQNQIIEAEKTELEEERSRTSESNTAWLQAKTELERVAAELSQANAELAHYKEHYFAAINQREELKANKRELEQQLESARNDYAVISNAACWKMTKPLRAFLDLLKRLPLLMLMIKALKCLKQNGFAYTWKKTKAKLRSQKQRGSLASSRVYSAEELEKQKQERFPRRVKISIIVPLYNTPEVFLKEMIQSVQGQTYADWELCMADGSDADHADVGRICRSFVRKDKRIKYRKLKENLGISGNSNACIEMASGDYIGLFDHDDLLHPAALYEVMHAICDKDADFVYTDENTFHKSPEDAYCPNFKPDFAPDTFRSYNYICHFSVFSKALLECCGGGFRSEYDGSQDYDLILRLTEKASCIVHIPKILYFWRSHEASTASSIEAKPYTLVAAKKALSEHLDRIGLKGEVLDARIPSTYRIQYELNGQPLVSILIPNKDHRVDLQKCVDSIREKSTYSNWEIIIIENNSTEQETFDYYDLLEKDERIHVVRWENEFNFSAINNFGARHARGEHLLLLNNDVEVIMPDWMEQMLMFSQRKDVGAVGAMLYYPDDTVQHAGVILGIGGVGGHAHKYFKRGDYGYMSRMAIAQNYSAVTAACLMLRREVWDQLQGLDESFKVAFNDVDFCMRIRKAGYLIVWTPFAELYHYESKSRGMEDTPEKQKRFEGEVLRFQARWGKELAAGDPYYNPNLSLEREDFSLREN